MSTSHRAALPHLSLLIVCDGGKALIMRNAGTMERPKLQMVETLQHQVPPTRDLGSERPGRVYASTGAARSAVEASDYHDAAETAFLGEVCRRVEHAVAGQTRGARLVLAAPPRVIGALRSLLPAPLRDTVAVEVGKDLTKLSIDDIERYFTE